MIQENKSATISCNNDQTLFQPVYSIQGSAIGREDKNGPQGNGINEDVGFTLNTTDRHAVAFVNVANCLSAADGPKGLHSQMLANPESYFVCDSPNVFYEKGFASFEQVDKAGTLRNSGGDNGGGTENLMVTNDYIVRRLTPRECARLQGFPDWWCSGLETEEPNESDLRFWRDVFETHRKIVTGATKSKTDKQIIKWLKNPHSDAAEYKMWGNGVALPCVCRVLSGIVDLINEENKGGTQIEE